MKRRRSRVAMWLFATTLAFSSEAFALGDPFSPVSDTLDLSKADKQLHLTLGYAVTLTGTAIMARNDVPRWTGLLYMGLGTLGAGLLKEIVIDGNFSYADMAYTAAGATLAGGAVYVFDLFPPPPAVTSATSIESIHTKP